MSNIPSSLPSGLPPPLNITTTTTTTTTTPGGGNRNKRRGSLFREPLPAAFRPTQQQQHRAATGRQNSIADVFLSGEDFVRNLGSDYEEVQKRTLTCWVNAKLSTLGDHIDRIETDLKDGKRLLKLLSVVSGQPAPKPERMNTRIHQLTNVAQALGFLQKLILPDNLPDIGNEAIVNGDVKKTLALIFYIMLKFQIQVILGDHGENYMESIAQLSERTSPSTATFLPDVPINDSPLSPTVRPGRRSNTNLAAAATTASERGFHSASDAKIALLYWVRIQLEDYTAANMISQIQDFSRSWRSGLAFCLLLHRHDPILIPDLLTNHIHADLSSKETWRMLLTTAFDIAALQLNIPRYLDPEDLIDVEYPHEPSIMMYVSEYYKVMSVAQRQEPNHAKRTKASKRQAAIAMAIGQEPDHDPTSIIFMDPPELLEDIAEVPDEKVVTEDQASEGESNDVTSPVVAESRTPLEAPVPIPVPAVRPQRSHHQRESSLGEKDKMRIQRDLNSSLVMQLTGQLPRGVHPILDQLLTIHDRVLTFIKTHTQTIDNMPDVFDGLDSVAEAISTIEAIEDKMPLQSAQLNAAKQACDTLTLSPESTDKGSMIHLTHLQRDHVTQLYQVSVTSWQDFEELVEVTKAELERIETNVVEVEDAIKAFKERAAPVEAEMVMLGQSVRELEQQQQKPTRADDDELDGYEQGIHDIMTQFQAFEASSWKAYCSTVRNLGTAGRRAVAHHLDLVQKVHDALEDSVNKVKKNCYLLREGIAFREILNALDKDISDVQEMMEVKTMDEQKKPVTDEAIAVLEDRLGSVKTRLQGVREQYIDLLEEPTLGFADRFAQVQDRYRVVGDWVDQIRVWFIEAGRISKWIEQRIQIVEARNQQSSKIDPLEPEFPLAELTKVAKTLNLEHEKLKREVEDFDNDDMTRLRNHVKKLTLADQSASQHKLSPADASTIEITLETLNRLYRLQELMDQQSMFVDTMVLRIEWEQLFNEAQAWIEKTHREMSEFMNGGKARYQQDTRTEEVIATLVELEQKVTKFDQTEYAAVLEGYQAMEDLRELPGHLEARQSAFEDSFENLMKRRVFCRKVVEQFLVVTDVVGQFERLIDQGELLLRNDPDTTTMESLQAFKDTSAYLMSDVAAHKIPYPEDVPETDMVAEDTQCNNDGNTSIRHLIAEYGMQLAVIAEQLEDMVVDQRQNLSLQERASLVYDEMVRITAWIEGRMASLVSPLELVDKTDKVDVEDLSRIDHERISLESRIMEMDHQSLINRVHAIETEIDATNASFIDRTMLIEAVEKLEHTYKNIMSTLDRCKTELSVCQTHAAWQTQWHETDKAILDVAHTVWDFTVKKAMFDPAREDESKSTIAKVTAHEQAMQDILVLKAQITDELLPETIRRYNSLVAERTPLSISRGNLPPVLAERHQELQDKHTELENLFAYALQALKQRHGIVDWLDAVQQATEQGHTVCDALEKAQERRIEQQQQQQYDLTILESQVNAFKQDVNRLQETSTVADKYEPKDPAHIGDRLHWDFDVIDPYEYHTRIQRQIRAFLDAKKDELCQVEDQVDGLYRVVQNTGRAKMLFSRYSAQIIEARGWISERLSQARYQGIDVLPNLPETRIIERQEEHQRLADEVDQFEEARLQPLKDKVSELEAGEQQQQQKDDITSLQRYLDEVLLDLDELKALLADQSAVMDVALKRIHWEQQYEPALSLIKALNEQLRQLAKERVSTTTDCVQERVGGWHQQIRQFRQQLDAFTQDEMAATHGAYRAFAKAVEQCGQMSETCIPVQLEAKMDALGHLYKRVDEQLVSQMRDLDLVQQRIDWEQAVDHVLEQMAKQGNVLDEYIQHQARWHPNLKENSNSCSVGQLKDQYQLHVARFESFQKHTLAPLKKQLEGPLTDASVQKLEALEKSEAQLRRHFAFAEEIVSQQDSLTDFLSKAAALEQEAGVIREIMLKSPPNTSTQIRVRDFSKQVDTMLQHKAQAIPYPERQEAEDTDYVQTKVHIQDKLSNEIVRDTIATRCSVLSELAQSLDEQLASKQRLSLCELLFNRNAKHVAMCAAWIKERQRQLQKYEQLLLQNDYEQPLTIAELKEALSSISGLDNAMQQGRDSVLSVLESLFEQAVAAFKLLDDEKLDSEFNQMTEARKRIQDEWQQLRHKTARLLATFSLLLEPTEIYYRAVKLGEDLATMERSVGQLDHATLTIDHVSHWQKRVDKLDAGTHLLLQQTLQSMVVNGNEGDRLVQVPLKAAKQQLDAASDRIMTVRAALSGFYDAVRLNHLLKIYVDNAKTAIRMMSAMQLSFKDVFVRFKKVTFEEHSRQRQWLTSTQRDVQSQMSDCKDAYNDLCEYYDFIHGQAPDNGGLSAEGTQLHKKAHDQWSTLQAEQEQFSLLVARAERWIEQYSVVGRLQRSLSTVQNELQSDYRVASYSSSTKSSSQKRRHGPGSSRSNGGGEAGLLASLEKRLATVARDLDVLLEYARDQEAHDPANSHSFIQFCDGESARVALLKNTLATRRADFDKTNRMTQYQEELKRHYAACEEQIQYIKQQFTSNQSVADKKPGSVQIVVQTYGAVLSGIRHIQHRAKESLADGTLAGQVNALVNTFHVLRSETDRLKRPLERALSNLEQRLNVEEAYVAVLKSVARHAEAEADLLTLLSDFKALVSKVSKNTRMVGTNTTANGTSEGDGTAGLPDLAEFGRRFNATDAATKEFYDAGNRIKTNLHKGQNIGGSRVDAITRAIDRRQDNVERKWVQIKVSADEARARVLGAQARAHVSAKMAETTRYVNGLKQRVNMLQLSGKSIALEHQELKDVQEEIKTMLSKKIKGMDAQLAGVQDKDGRIKRQRHELAASVQDLEKLVQTRLEQAETEGNISTFLDVVDKIDDAIVELSRLVESCAPHHAQLVQNRFDKTDLQSMLQRLNSGYKEREPRIAEWIDAAKLEARQQCVDKHERVVERLGRTRAQWVRVQSEAGAREKELQTCIHQLNHEFFTKLALAKSTSTHTKNSGSGSDSSSSSRRTGRLPVPVPYLSSHQRHRKPRGGFRSSTTSVDNRAVGRRTTPTHSMSGGSARKRAPNYVVTDPKSELDIQLSRIANESSYQMKIKMVPGEVGKYWFGDEQPRLMYCRILPSKMVMVRVGGGWEELSKFLKSHGHLYVAESSDKTSSGDSSPSNSPQSVSPGVSTTSTLTLRGRGNRPLPSAAVASTPVQLSSSINTTGGGGYMGEANRGIRIDEDRN